MVQSKGGAHSTYEARLPQVANSALKIVTATGMMISGFVTVEK